MSEAEQLSLPDDTPAAEPSEPTAGTSDPALDEAAVLAEAQRRLLARRQELEQLAATEAARVRDQGGRASSPSRLGPPPIVGDRVKYASKPTQRPGTEWMRVTPYGKRILEDPSLPKGAGVLLYLVPPPGALEQAPPSDVEARIREMVPERFHGVSWATIPSLTYDRQPSLGTVESRSGKRLRGAEAATDVQRRIERSTKVVLLGDTSAGKSLCAAAALEAEIRRGTDRARWFHVGTLKEPGVLERALSSAFLVLDDLGYELNGARAGSGWLPSLTAPACDLFARWYQLRDRRLVVTTFLDIDAMGEFYGHGMARRVYEGADIIRLFRE